jgi:MFS family permease
MMRRPATEGGNPLQPGLTSRIATDLRSLPRQFWLLAGGTFVYLIGVEMVYPFETIYLNRNLGVSMTVVGLILGVSMLATLPMQVVGGALCDRLGRRPLLTVAVLGSMTLYVGLGLTRDLWVVVALIAFEAAFGWAQFITASNAMVADLTPPGRRAEAFSILRVALNTGITVGPLIAAPLIVADPSFRLPFLTGGAVCWIVLLLIVLLLKETRPAAAGVVSIVASFRGYGRVLRDRRMLGCCLVALLPLYGFGQIWVTTPIMLGDLHDVTAQMWGIALVVYGASTAILQYPVIRIVGDRDHMLLLALSCVATSVGLGAAAFVPWPATLLCVVSISFGIVLLIPISSTVVSRLAPVDLRGRYMGLWTLVYVGGYALGPLIGGWALDRLGGHGAFLVIAATGLLGAVLFVLLRGRLAPAEGARREHEVETLGDPLRGERPEQAI